MGLISSGPKSSSPWTVAATATYKIDSSPTKNRLEQGHFVDRSNELANQGQPSAYQLLGLAVNAIPAAPPRPATHRPNRGKISSRIPLSPTLSSSPPDSAVLALLVARTCGFLGFLFGWFLCSAAASSSPLCCSSSPFPARLLLCSREIPPFFLCRIPLFLLWSSVPGRTERAGSWLIGFSAAASPSPLRWLLSRS